MTLPRSGARVRRRGGGDRAAMRVSDIRRWRRRRRARRGPARRTGDARDARRSRACSRACRSATSVALRHRRTILRRHARTVHRPRLAGGGRGRADRAACATATSIAIDLPARQLDVERSTECGARASRELRHGRRRQPKFTRGWLSRYAAMVTNAQHRRGARAYRHARAVRERRRCTVKTPYRSGAAALARRSCARRSCARAST